MKKVIIIILSIIISNVAFSQISKTNLDRNFQNGQIIASDNGTLNTSSNLQLTTHAYDYNMVGVYVNRKFKPDPTKDVQIIPRNKYVATSEIVEVRYNSEGGQIKKGDPVTSSSQPGVAMKATKSGIILGIALEDANADSGLIKIRLMIQYLKQ